MIQCFVSDLDGTLLDGQDLLPKESADVIREVMQNGYEFIIASGRSKDSVAKLLHPYRLHCTRILCNGALILAQDDSVLYEKALDLDRIQRMIAILSKLHFDIQLYTNAGNAAFDADRIRNRFIRTIMDDRNMNQIQAQAYINERFFFDYHVIITDWDAYTASTPIIYKLEAYCDTEAMLYEAIQALAPIADLDINIAGLGLEITDIHAQKGIALHWLTEQLRFAKETVAVFGDGMNDRKMLQDYPNSFVTDNAKAEVKAFAKYIIGSHKEQSVAKTIQQIFRNQGKLSV